MLTVAGGIVLAWLIIAFKEHILLALWVLLIAVVIGAGLYGASHPAPPPGVMVTR